ncbi:hypothetical protein D3C87_1671260 [compost metagenome]
MGVALTVRLKKLNVPLLSIDDNTLLIVTVPALVTKLPLTVNVRTTEKEFVVVAPLALITKLPYDWPLFSAATTFVVPAYSIVLVLPIEWVL